jgi:glutathione S-transferase
MREAAHNFHLSTFWAILTVHPWRTSRFSAAAGIEACAEVITRREPILQKPLTMTESAPIGDLSPFFPIMVELYQLPWSPYCFVIKRLLEYGAVPHRLVRVSAVDRSRVWTLTRQRYYQLPIIKHDRTVLFETDGASQVIAKYIDGEFGLGLFPPQWEGIQKIVWRYVEDDIEGFTFRLNDVYYKEFVPKSDQLAFLRHKERKFGVGCLDLWRRQSSVILKDLQRALLPFEQMLRGRAFLLDEQPRFLDFDLWGMLGTLLFSGHYKLPRALPRLRQWYEHLSTLRSSDLPSEKLHS